MNELHTAGHRGREANAVVGPEHIVVHRLGHGQDLDLPSQPLGIRQGVIALDGDQPVQAEAVDHGQTMAGEVERPLGLELALAGQEPRHVGRLDLGRVGPAGVQERPPVRSMVRTSRFPAAAHTGPGTGRRPGCSPTARPSPPQPDDLIAPVHRRVHQGLDARVEPGDVAATGQHTNTGHAYASNEGCRGGRASLRGRGRDRSRPVRIPSAGDGRPSARLPRPPRRAGDAGVGDHGPGRGQVH